MGLESFNSDTPDSNDEPASDSKTKDRISHLIDELDNATITGESQEHYNTKLRAAIALSTAGYRVYIEHQYNDDSQERADVYAELDEEEVGIGYETLICEIGKYSASRAVKAVNIVDCIILIPIGGSISDSLVLKDEDLELSGQDPLDSTFMSEVTSDVYINSKGEPFIPKIGDIHIQRYKVIASDILSSIQNAEGMSNKELLRKIKESTDNTYDDDDILKVAEVIGFTES